METTQGISLHSYLYLKLAKTSCFSYHLLCFFFYKIREQEGESGSARRQRGWGWVVERGDGTNNVYTRNTKMAPVETVPIIGGGGEREQQRGKFKYDIFDTL
jgi:hypothetical protein